MEGLTRGLSGYVPVSAGKDGKQTDRQICNHNFLGPVYNCHRARGTVGDLARGLSGDEPISGGQNTSVGSVLGLLSCVIQLHRFEPSLSLW